MLHQPINSLTNTRKIFKLCVDVYGYGYGYGCVNANVAVFVSVNGNAADCVDVYEKFFASIDKAKWLCYNGLIK